MNALQQLNGYKVFLEDKQLDTQLILEVEGIKNDQDKLLRYAKTFLLSKGFRVDPDRPLGTFQAIKCLLIYAFRHD